MKFTVTRIGLAIASAGLLTLAGCGGGGGGTSAASTSSALSGTAATGAPIAGQVVAIDSAGTKFYATTSSDGAYTLNVTGGVAPFILTVTGTSGGQAVTLNSIATAVGQTVNITPLTDLILSTAAGQTGGATFAALCASTVPADQTACRAAATTATTGTRLSQAVTAVKAMIAPLDATGADPLNGAFAANGTSAMDAVLDKILVTPAASFGAMATVTLIAVPTQQLGTMTLGASAGTTTTPATITPSGANITAATTANVVLGEIKTCLSELAALYPSTLATGTSPTLGQVTPFVDATASLGGAGTTQTASQIRTYLSTPGSSGGLARAGFNLPVRGLSTFDFTPVVNGNVAAITTASPIVSSTVAWVQLGIGGNSENWKMVKGAAYGSNCAGWKIAGNGGRIDMHMQPRISKSKAVGGAITYARSLPLHVDGSNRTAENIGSIKVSHPSLRVYSGNTGAPVGVQQEIVLIAGTSGNTAMQIVNHPVANSDAIPSCQDYATASSPVTGAPCYDETALKPGDAFTWFTYPSGVTNATGTSDYSFAYQVGAVPLSKAFIEANHADLFAQSITTTPASIAALNAAAGTGTGASITGLVTYNYTQSTVYGAVTDHCAIKLYDAANTGNMALKAEANAVKQQSSCALTDTFVGQNSGSLTKTVAAFGGNSVIWVANRVLGMQAVSTQPY
jgi:hypothetical protein